MGKVKTKDGGKSVDKGSEANDAPTRSNPKRRAKKPERLEYDPDTHVTGIARWKKFKVSFAVIIMSNIYYVHNHIVFIYV